jgi:PAS domain S-box-containing protein
MADQLPSDEHTDNSDGPRTAAVDLIESLSSHAVFMVDTEGRIATWPTPAEELYGYDEATMSNEHVRTLFADDHGEQTVEDVSAVLADARANTVDVSAWQECADGSVFWGSLTFSPLADENIEGIVVVCEDTTTTMEYQQMLERKNDRLKEFTDILAHDLRNPLNAIDQYIELYEATGEQSHIESIDETTDRMARLVEDLLRVARQGDVVQNPEPTDLETVVRTAWEGAGSADASLQYSSVPTVSAAPDRLCELFENLFRNAVEHGVTDDQARTDSPEQGVSVRVGPLAEGFYVEDDGPGIPAELDGEVFDHGVTTARNGSGYGLSIVRTIVNAHGWEISLGTAETGGARFEITGIEFLD